MNFRVFYEIKCPGFVPCCGNFPVTAENSAEATHFDYEQIQPILERQGHIAKRELTINVKPLTPEAGHEQLELAATLPHPEDLAARTALANKTPAPLASVLEQAQASQNWRDNHEESPIERHPNFEHLKEAYGSW
jgi:hypothetical protein